MYRRRSNMSLRVKADQNSVRPTLAPNKTPLIDNEFETPLIDDKTIPPKAASVKIESTDSMPTLESLDMTERKGRYIFICNL